MSDCLGADELTTLSSALGWEGDGRLVHLASCTECRALLRELSTAHAVLAAREDPSDEWLSETQQLIEREAAAVSDRELGTHLRIGAAVLLFALAAAATMLLLLPAPGTPPGSFSPAVAAVLSTVVGAVVAARYSWSRREG